MRIRFGYDLVFECAQPTLMTLRVQTHPSLLPDLIRHDEMVLHPHAATAVSLDAFGNHCTRIEATAGVLRATAEGLIEDAGVVEPEYPFAKEHAVSLLPEDAAMYLASSRHCETEPAMEEARRSFGAVKPGWARVQAISAQAHRQGLAGSGTAEEFVHPAIAWCRCLNIPARYCSGYVARVGEAAAGEPGRFAAWFEAYLGGAWHPFDPFLNERRAGRILIARGRDAADVEMASGSSDSFALTASRVWAEEVADDAEAGSDGFLNERFGPVRLVE